MGLVPVMAQNYYVKSIVRSACAIPLLPKTVMARGLQTLITEAERKHVIIALKEFFEYFTQTWMCKHFETLSVYGLKHRTNNLAESCNKMLRVKTGAHRPSLWHFICKYFL